MIPNNDDFEFYYSDDPVLNGKPPNFYPKDWNFEIIRKHQLNTDILSKSLINNPIPNNWEIITSIMIDEKKRNIYRTKAIELDSENEVIDNIATTENIANMNSLKNHGDKDLEVIYLDNRDDNENNDMNVNSNIESYEPYIPDENEIYENTNSPAFELPSTIDDQEERQERQNANQYDYQDNKQDDNQEVNQENTNLTSMDDLLTNKGANLQVKKV